MFHVDYWAADHTSGTKYYAAAHFRRDDNSMAITVFHYGKISRPLNVLHVFVSSDDNGSTVADLGAAFLRKRDAKQKGGYEVSPSSFTLRSQTMSTLPGNMTLEIDMLRRNSSKFLNAFNELIGEGSIDGAMPTEQTIEPKIITVSTTLSSMSDFGDW